MNSYMLLTDSSADLPQYLLDELDISVLPLSFTMDGKVYRNFPDEREIKSTDFYAALRGGAQVQTSAVNVEQFTDILRPVLESGRDVLYLGFSSALSSTYSAGYIAAQELSEEFPQRKILTVDTLAASQGQGMLVYLTAKKRAEGMSIEEAAQYAEDTKLHICHWFTVDDLFFLKRGGRVSAATAILGTTLGIKPILHVDNEGRLINVGKARGRKNSIATIAAKMKSDGIDPSTQTPFIVHGDCIDDANTLADILRRDCGVKDVIINYVGPVIGAHSGPNTLSVFFVGKER